MDALAHAAAPAVSQHAASPLLTAAAGGWRVWGRGRRPTIGVGTGPRGDLPPFVNRGAHGPAGPAGLSNTPAAQSGPQLPLLLTGNN